jgi:hypothetical protein
MAERQSDARAMLDLRRDQIEARVSERASSSAFSASSSASSSQTSSAASEAINRSRNLLTRVSDLDALTRGSRELSISDEVALALQAREREQLDANAARAGIDMSTMYNPKVTVNYSSAANISSVRSYAVGTGQIEKEVNASSRIQTTAPPATAPSKRTQIDEDPALWSFSKP